MFLLYGSHFFVKKNHGMVCYGRRMIDGHTQKRSIETKTISWMVINAFFLFLFRCLCVFNICYFLTYPLFLILCYTTYCVCACCIYIFWSRTIFFIFYFLCFSQPSLLEYLVSIKKNRWVYQEEELKSDLPSLEIHCSKQFSKVFLV